MQQGLEGFRLSPQQQRVWQFATQADNSVYCAQVAIAISGNLDLTTLKTTVQRVMERHEILRTTFHCLPEMTFPLQAIAPDPTHSLRVEDWNHLSIHDQFKQLDTRWVELRQQLFDLNQEPAFHLELIRQSAQHHTLLLHLSALCADAVTLYNIAQEISKTYAVLGQRQSLEKVEAPLQYADLAEWQHELLEEDAAQAGKEYWSQLGIVRSTARLPFEKTATEKAEFQPQVYTLTLPTDLIDQAKAFSHQHGTTVSTLLLTCWQVLLWRFTQQSPLTVGIGCKGRKYEELESALGLFAKTLPLAYVLEETVPFLEYLQQTQKSLDAHDEWQDYFAGTAMAKGRRSVIATSPPTNEINSTQSSPISGDLEGKSRLSPTQPSLPFFPFGFEFETQPEPWTIADIKFSIDRLWVCTERFKVKLVCCQQGNVVNTTFHYDSHYYVAEDIQRLAGYFQTLLTSILQSPEAVIGQLNFLTPAERQQLLVEFNPPASQIAQKQLIHQLFEGQVVNNPDQVAILFPDSALTYGELNIRANQLAHYLRALGVQTGDLVGLCVARSPLMAVGILGILKAGAAYVPLDPTYPPERLNYMLQDVQISVLLTQSDWGSNPCPMLEASQPIQRVYLDEQWPVISQFPIDNPSAQDIKPDLAYIIYTSGSTGKPKGVQISHDNLCHYVHAMQQSLEIQTNDIYLHTASIAFSSSVRQLMMPLCHGAMVAISTTEQRTDPLLLFAAIQQYGVTVIDVVPSYWRNCIQRLMGLPEVERVCLLNNALRLILSASEPLWTDIARRWRQEVKHPAQLINMFGQTETSGIVAVYLIPQTLDAGMSVVPLGQPIANTQLYLLDLFLQPVPLGVTGELYVGGSGVGQGYLNQPELTEARFIPDPFGTAGGDRLYKTGDLARYRGDGTLEFVSRIDNQVKLRGFRIELGEIEAVLVQHSLVQEAAVVLRGEDPEQAYLAAYVVRPSPPAPLPERERGDGTLRSSEIADISAWLRSHLPDYMVPATIVALDALPLTPNGKLDRPSLPDPALMEIDQNYEAPRSPVETVLANLWTQLLHQGQVGIHDNFFDLGGHSLLATQVISQVRDAFHVELPLRALFQAPTVAELSDRIETLMRSGQGLAVLTLQRGERTDPIPLSFGQQRLWFLEQLEPGNASYNLFRAVRLQGVLNQAALAQSFNELIRRHEALRTCFKEAENQIAQVISEFQSFSLLVIDLSSIPESQQGIEIRRQAKLEAQRTFDLTQAPLLRATLLSLSPNSQVLFLTLHHIIADGWSARILVRELAVLYDHFCKDISAPIVPKLLPDLPIQYADFALWQQHWLQDGLLDPQLAYWQQQLAGDLPLLSLPTDRPRPAVQSFKGKTQTWQISQSLTASLQQLSQQAGGTLFMTLLAAFKILLYRYTGQTDVLIGSPIANRNRTEIEGLIGFFVNTLVLRTDLSGNPTFQELLRRVRETTLSAYTHQDFPFEKLIEVLQPERSLSYSPLFQVMFGLQKDPLQDLALTNLDVSILEIETETARFDLTLSLMETEQGLRGTVEYNSNLFDVATIERMLDHYEVLLASIVVDSQQTIAHLPLLSNLEKQQVLAVWNQTQVDYDAQTGILPRCIEAQAAKIPDAIALTFADQHLTYQELDSRANQLAHTLQARGVKPEVLVGICVERSLDMVVALLGILKAGGAYLPLDVSYPQERLTYLIETAQPQLLLTQASCRGCLPASAVPVVCLDGDRIDIAQQPTTNPHVTLSPEDLAYVLYTSGSTGQPKGVEIPHRALTNFLTSMQIRPGLMEQDTLLAVTTLSFDIAALELFLPLTVGARVAIATRETAMDGAQLQALLQQSGATIMQATPATWQLLLNAGWEGDPKLKILCGGEALSPQLAQRLAQCSASLWNLYGPTETTIWSLISHIDDQGITTGSESVNIGRQIANTQIYVLDEQLQPLPIGIPGELYIAGDGVARGYRHRLDLTTERFIPSPFQAGDRLYKTGDRVRYCLDGSLEFLGRLDYQVKVRGFRVELGEVEIILGQHPAVQSAIALAQKDQLFAYVVAAEALCSGSELQLWLQQKLPSYMVPSAILVLPAFPLTPNGKVDRHALGQLQPVDLPSSDLGQRTPTQELLISIWSQVLGLEQVGLYENFFALGGHSLLATQLVSRIRAVFAVEVPLQQLFETPTILGLAAYLDATCHDQGVMLPPMERVGRDRTFPLSFAQQRLWFLEQVEPDTATYNIPAAVRLRGHLDIAALEQSINALIERHEVLRTTFTSLEGQPLQTIHPASPFPMTVTDLSTLDHPQLSEQLLATAQQPFDLAHGPLLRVELLRLEATDHVALFVMHHIVADGWSMGVLIREIGALYRAFRTGDLVSLPELPIQYADFALWQQQWLQGSVLETKLTYWKQQLANLVPLQLPSDRPRETVSNSPGAAHSFYLSPQTSEALVTFSRQENVTLFMTLLTAFQILLHRHTQQEDIVVGTDVANRTDLAIEGLIGFFVNLLVLSTDLSGNPSVREALQRVRTVTLGAYAHQDVPFAKVVEALRPERQLKAIPLFQVLFVLQNAPMPPLELPGLMLEQLEVDSGAARFDIALFLTETEQGIKGVWRYNTQLFAADTIACLVSHFETLLGSLYDHPDARIHTLPMLSQTEQKNQSMQQQQRQASRFQKFASIKPQSIRLDADQLIQNSFLHSNAAFPLVIQSGVDALDIVDWAKAHHPFLESKLLHHGAVLFRGVGIDSATAFETLAVAICPRLYGEYGDLPRQDVSGKIYGATPYPANQAILFHSESSHLQSWPQKIWFCCLQPAQQGGETPIVDCRQILQLLDPKLRDRFAQLQLLYVRNYIDGLDVSWQEFFRTSDRAVVEATCRQAGIDYEWLPDNGLRTKQIRPAIARHPQSDESVFFNQIQLHHPACLEPDVRGSLLASFGSPDNFPRNVYYGDGSTIEDEVVQEILEIYQAIQVSFPWQEGDVLMLDNMLMAHGRNPYVGSRQVVVAMGDMISSEKQVRQSKEAAHAH
ncbi:MAG: amino acid adenylation domain-containing protein [Acaryochloris sp. RU_4_1]|nr:amino acid adenylation domain-containing protein [Acaryochloris sp. RU_4_1]NJR53709.1 amino acid adenylation domain-containing protein [Acaryochloris sp. CRU_2_0]